MSFKSGLKDAQGGGKPNTGGEAVPVSRASHIKGSFTLLPKVGCRDLEISLARGSQSPDVVGGRQEFCDVGWCETI